MKHRMRAQIDDPIDWKSAVDLFFSPHCPEQPFVIKQGGFRMLASAEINDYTGAPFTVVLNAFNYDGRTLGWQKFELWKLDRPKFLDAVGEWFGVLLEKSRKENDDGSLP